MVIFLAIRFYFLWTEELLAPDPVRVELDQHGVALLGTTTKHNFKYIIIV